MIFVIQYDRAEGTIRDLKDYDETQRVQAEEERLSLELRLRREGISHDAVLVEADSPEALQENYRRFF